jgi:dTDP-4-amino-4,6-dideoxygalactose transaminase
VVSSGTSGIELALRATALAARPHILVASFTFAAGPLCILRLGRTPIFLDIDATSWQPSIADARQYLAYHHHSVAAILLTTTFGVANDRVQDWEKLAVDYGLPLIIDSAAGFGSTEPTGTPLGRHGDCEVFSLHATKTLGIGEGGIVTSRSDELIDYINQLKNFGFGPDRTSIAIGMNAKLPELSCAIASRQLASLSDRISARQHLLSSYAKELIPLGFTFQPNANSSAVAFVSTLSPDKDTRNAVIRYLRDDHIEVRTYYNPPVHRQPLFAHSKTVGELPVTKDFSDRIISLPTRSNMIPSDFHRITRAVKSALA